jgi:hypothetical protein
MRGCWGRWLGIGLLAGLLSGCGGNTGSRGGTTSLPKLMVPIPEGATQIACFYNPEPRLIYNYQMKLPKDSLKVFELCEKSLAEQGWKNDPKSPFSNKKFGPLSEDPPEHGNQMLAYIWKSPDKKYFFFLKIKAKNFSTVPGKVEYQMQYVNINVAPSDHVAHEPGEEKITK